MSTILGPVLDTLKRQESNKIDYHKLPLYQIVHQLGSVSDEHNEQLLADLNTALIIERDFATETFFQRVRQTFIITFFWCE